MNHPSLQPFLYWKHCMGCCQRRRMKESCARPCLATWLAVWRCVWHLITHETPAHCPRLATIVVWMAGARLSREKGLPGPGRGGADIPIDIAPALTPLPFISLPPYLSPLIHLPPLNLARSSPPLPPSLVPLILSAHLPPIPSFPLVESILVWVHVGSTWFLVWVWSGSGPVWF